jgi:cell division protein FtsL
MNAAARLASQGVIARSWSISLVWARAQFSTMVLTLAVLTTAMSMVYITNSTRSLNATYQQALAEQDRIHVQWGQLLLEKSTRVEQARVQKIAENKLSMVIPDSKSVMIVAAG